MVLEHPCTLATADNIPHRRSFTSAVAGRSDVAPVDLAADGFTPTMTAADPAA